MDVDMLDYDYDADAQECIKTTISSVKRRLEP